MSEPPTTTARVWHESFHIRAYEIDPSGHLSIQALCDYLQEAAGNHAGNLGVSVEQLLAERNLTWVLARLHVVLRQRPAWRETIRLETWPSGENGLFAMRAFQLTDEAGDRVGEAMSAWLLMDPVRRRPVRVPPFIKAIRLPDRPPPLPEAFERFTPPEHHESTHPFRVRYSDLDLNQHVNNVRYIEWANECVAPALAPTHDLVELEIQFRAEATYGDTVLAHLLEQPGDDRRFVHHLQRESDGKDLALAHTRWVERE